MAEPEINRVFLALGSNIDPVRNLTAACDQLAVHGTALVSSRVWETAPIGYHDQPPFLNAAVLLQTPASVRQLRCEVIPTIESQLQRKRDPQNRNGPRTIDIDIALFNREVLECDGCCIPDPDILTRPFLALTLAELDGDYLHPQTGTTLAEISRKLTDDVSGMRLRHDLELPGAPRV